MKWLLLAIPVMTGCCYDNCNLHGDWTIGFKHDGCGYNCDGGGPYHGHIDDTWPVEADAVPGKFHPVPTRPVFEPPRRTAPAVGEPVPAEMMPQTSRSATRPASGRSRPRLSNASKALPAANLAAVDEEIEDSSPIRLASGDDGQTKSAAQASACLTASFEEPIADSQERSESVHFYAIANDAPIQAEQDVSAAKPATWPPATTASQVAPRITPASEWRPSQRATVRQPQTSPPI